MIILGCTNGFKVHLCKNSFIIIHTFKGWFCWLNAQMVYKNHHCPFLFPNFLLNDNKKTLYTIPYLNNLLLYLRQQMKNNVCVLLPLYVRMCNVCTVCQ